MRSNPRLSAGLALGVVVLLIPGRWALGADVHGPAEVESRSSGAAPARVTPLPVGSPTEVEGRRRRIADALLQIEGAEFYEAVGRPDLAKRYEARRSDKSAVRVTGGALMGAGLVVMTVILLGTVGTCDGGCPTDSSPPRALIIPDAMLLGGLALLVAPSMFDTDPVSDEEKADLAEAEAEKRTRSLTRPVGLSLAPRPEDNGAGITFSGRF